MSNYVNDALLGASPYKKQADESKRLVAKWEKTGLLEGLNEDFQKSGMATLLENQARQLLTEFSGTGGRSGGTTSVTANSEDTHELQSGGLIIPIFSSVSHKDSGVAFSL